MNKVCIVGCGGSGKSTFAGKLGEATGLPVYYLDVYFWQAGWVERKKEEWHSILHNLLAKDQWIMDGNFNNTQDIRFEKADTIILLDLPRYRCMINALKRLYIYRRKKRIDMADGCYEKIDYEFYKWIWEYKKKHGVQTMRRLEKLQGEKEIVVLRSYKEMEEFLKKIKGDSGFPPSRLPAAGRGMTKSLKPPAVLLP
jgi:adenylate kinase family enzyme